MHKESFIVNGNNCQDKILLAPSSKFLIMKAMSFIQEYFYLKQLLQINQSVNLIQSFMEHKQQQESLDLLVPYVMSENVSQESSFTQVAIQSQAQFVKKQMNVINSGGQIFTQCQYFVCQDQNFTDQQNLSNQQTYLNQQNQQKQLNQRQNMNKFNIKQLIKAQNALKNSSIITQIKRKCVQSDCQNSQNKLMDQQNYITWQLNKEKNINDLKSKQIQLLIKQEAAQKNNRINILNILQKTADSRQSKIKEWNQQIYNFNSKYKLRNIQIQSPTSYLKYKQTIIQSLNQQNKNLFNYQNFCKIVKYEKKSLKQQILKKIKTQKQKNDYKLTDRLKEDKQFLQKYLQD